MSAATTAGQRPKTGWTFSIDVEGDARVAEAIIRRAIDDLMDDLGDHNFDASISVFPQRLPDRQRVEHRHATATVETPAWWPSERS